MLLVVLLLAGCSTQSQVLQMPSVPRDQFDTIKVPVKFPPLSNLAQNTVQVPYADIPVKSTVVINFGSTRQRSDSSGVNLDETLSVVKEEVQKELIRRGLRVLDQEQVNSQLLKLAMDQSCKDDRLWWRCTTYLDRGEVAYIDKLQVSFEQGQVQRQVYAAELQKYRGLWEERATGMKALMGAIQQGKIESDYVLEIKSFKPGEIKQSFNLSKLPDIRGLINNYPDLQSQFAGKQYLRCTTLASEIKARLINTKTAEVLWFGNHTVSELDQPGNALVVELGVRRYVANGDEVVAFVNDFNNTRGKKRAPDSKVPGWKYDNALVGPNLLQGTCSTANRQRSELQKVSDNLAGQVVRELIDTIEVSGGYGNTAPTTFKANTPSLESAEGGKRLNNSIGPIGPVRLN